MTRSAHFAMMRLASPALPIGGFSYSQGLETAIELGWVEDEVSLVAWLQDCLTLNIGRYEAPLAWSLFDALNRDDHALAEQLHEEYLASRESAELRAETVQMGYSLLRLLAGLDDTHQRSAPMKQHDTPTTAELPRPSITRARERLNTDAPCSLPLAWGLAAHALELSADQALDCYLWAWLENQIAAAIKAVPLGQQCGQRIIESVAAQLAATATQAPDIKQADWSNFAPGFAMASCWHENQYSRLFRS